MSDHRETFYPNYTRTKQDNRQNISFPFYLSGNEEDGTGARPPQTGRYSPRVFVSGLPLDISQAEVAYSFGRFGNLSVQWANNDQNNNLDLSSHRGHAYLQYMDSSSVQRLVNSCIKSYRYLFYKVDSSTFHDKSVQIHPFPLNKIDYVTDPHMPLEPRNTLFLHRVCQSVNAHELAAIMNNSFGGVAYAGIDVDPLHKYPTGHARVTFDNGRSYASAIRKRFIRVRPNLNRVVEMTPFILDCQMCDECHGARCGGAFATLFCGNVACLQYYCEQCWLAVHGQHSYRCHRLFIKNWEEQPRLTLGI